MSRARLTQRIARLERWNKLQPQHQASILTADERNARIRLLILRLMNALGISPSDDESLADAALRAASTAKGFSNRWVPIVRQIFGADESSAGSTTALPGGLESSRPVWLGDEAKQL